MQIRQWFTPNSIEYKKYIPRNIEIFNRAPKKKTWKIEKLFEMPTYIHTNMLTLEKPCSKVFLLSLVTTHPESKLVQFDISEIFVRGTKQWATSTSGVDLKILNVTNTRAHHE